MKKENKTDKNSLSLLVEAIDKEYGQGSIMKMDASGEKVIPSISSQSLALDIALGNGGFPKGRIIECIGAESSGKCLTEDSYILTANNGYKTIKQIFNNNGLETFCSNKTVALEYELVNIESKKEKTTHFTLNGRKKVFGIKTETGYVHKGTYKHPLLCLSKNGNFVWKWIGEMEVGDYVVNIGKNSFFGSNSDIDEVEAYMAGLLVADGSFQKNRIAVTNDDPDVKLFIEEASGHCGFSSYRKYDNNNKGSFDYHFNVKNDVEGFYEKFKLHPTLSKNKELSEFIMEFNEELMSSFLCGYLDSEAYFSQSTLEVSSASHILLYQIKLILSQFNIISTITKKKVKKYPDNDYWTLYITGQGYTDFIKKIGLKFSKSTKQRNKMLKISEKTLTLRNIPNIQNMLADLYLSSTNRNVCRGNILSDIFTKKINCSQKNLDTFLRETEVTDLNRTQHNHLNLISKFNYEKVEETFYVGEVPVFDFAMSKTHTFIADGCVNHNTTLCLHTIAEVQQQGGNAAFIDAEHAFDKYYAQNIGVDVKNLLVSQPDNGEQALNIAEKLIASKLLDIVVIDSVAALTPKAEIEGEVGDSKMGLQARMMSQALRKITGITSKSNTCVIFVNQIREKIGVIWGAHETTTGGNALKFYASIRLDVRRIGQNKDGEEIISNKTRVKVIKNKVAPPFKTAEFDIVFGEGIDMFGEVIDLAVEFEIIRRAGSWFSYGETKLGQGRNAVRSLLKDNPELFIELKEKILKNIKEL